MKYLSFPSKELLTTRIQENWKAGLTVALISVPLSIALSIASGAGPIPGLITGIWATLIASIFGSSNYNIIGAAGALSTVLFAVTLNAPLGLGPAILPILTIVTGIIIFFVWVANIDRFFYFIPSSVMYGFAVGVALLIAASQLFDATGLSDLARTGSLIGDIKLYIENAEYTHTASAVVFFVFLAAILTWKKYIKALPAVIPISIIGIIFGFLESTYLPLDLISLGDKFGSFSGTLYAPVPWHAIPSIISDPQTIVWILKAAGTIALIAVLETLITAKIGDKVTKTQSSSHKELLGLALANIGSGAFGGLPATGVFIRTGANIKAGATHKTSASIAAIMTAIISLLVLPFFVYIPMAIIAAILVNTALGLIEYDRFKELYISERASFFIATVVVLITIFEDAGLAVMIGAMLSLFWFTDRISHGRFDAVFNFKDGSKKEIKGERSLEIPKHKDIYILTYSIAGFLGYIDSERHAENLRHIAHTSTVECVIIRLRGLFAADFEGQEMLEHAVEELEQNGKKVYICSASEAIQKELETFPEFKKALHENRFKNKTSDVLRELAQKTH